MAKKIRFPLMMKDGTAVRTLEELREHFDLESVLGYFADGKLKTWLADRYYDEKAQKIAELTADMPDLNAKLCEILGVDYSAESDDIDFEYLQKRQKKLNALRMFTDDQMILEKVDAVAFDQDELYDILDEAPAKIYLYGEKFSIPYAKRGITYIGINTPIVSLEKSKYEYEDNGIDLINVKIDDSNQNAPYIYAERLYIKGDYKNALPLIKKEAENGNPRAMSLLALMYFNGLGCEHSKEKGKKWLNEAKDLNAPLSVIYSRYYRSYFNTPFLVHEQILDLMKSIQEQNYRKSLEKIRKLADSGDTIAQFEYVFANCQLSLDDKATQFLFESANKGFAPSIRWLANHRNYLTIFPQHSYFFSDDPVADWELEALVKFNRYYQEGKIEDIKRMLFG